MGTHICGKRALTLADCSDCAKLRSMIEDLREDMEACCTDVQGRLTDAEQTIDDIQNIIDNLENVVIRSVEELPQTGETNTIYLVPKQGDPDDVKEEYIWVDEHWEKIGNTSIDLSGYVDTATYNENMRTIADVDNDQCQRISNIEEEITSGTGLVHDVKVNNTSVTTAGIANIDLTGYATQGDLINGLSDKQDQIYHVGQDTSLDYRLPNNSETSITIYTADGDYILIGYAYVSFASNSTGRRGIAAFLRDAATSTSYPITRANNTALNGIDTRLSIPIVTAVATGETIGIQLYQNSGSAMNVAYYTDFVTIPMQY